MLELEVGGVGARDPELERESICDALAVDVESAFDGQPASWTGRCSRSNATSGGVSERVMFNADGEDGREDDGERGT